MPKNAGKSSPGVKKIHHQNIMTDPTSVLDFSLPQMDRLNLFVDFDSEVQLTILRDIQFIYRTTSSSIIFDFVLEIARQPSVHIEVKMECLRLLIENEAEPSAIEDMRMLIIAENLHNKANNANKALPVPVWVDLLFAILLSSSKEGSIIQAQQGFREVIMQYSLDSKYRFKSILKLPEGTAFRREMMHTFFDEKWNDITYRILASQELLTDPQCEFRDDIEEKLLHTARNLSVSRNVRADICDTLLNVGSEISREGATTLLRDLGGSNILYENKENVHQKSIVESVQNILRKLYARGLTQDWKLEDIVGELTNVVPLSSLDRIECDRTFYAGTYTLRDILVRIWDYIQASPHKDSLTTRLIQELTEMEGTCTSGFVSRLVNVLSGYDADLSIRISFADEIGAKFSHKIHTAIQDLKDGDSNSFYELLVEQSGETDMLKKLDLMRFFNCIFPDVWGKLWEEYAAYMDKSEFDDIMTSIVRDFNI